MLWQHARISIGVPISLLIVLFLGNPLQAQSFRRGDTNSDSVVNMSDFISLLGHLFLGTSPTLACEDAADMNDSGHIDLSDVIILYGFLFHGSVLVSPPFPNCGTDPTPDSLSCEESVCTNQLPGHIPSASWFDSEADNSMVRDDSLFEVQIHDHLPILSTDSAAINIHSHYISPASSSWQSYDFSGKMLRVAQEGGGIGVTFLSDYPNSDTYYRLRQSGAEDLHIAPHGTSITGGQERSQVVPAANSWYRFRIAVDDTGRRTEIKAKVWAESDPEPNDWQIDCYDSSSTRITAGTVGCWSMGPEVQLKSWAEFYVNDEPLPFVSESPLLVLNSSRTFLSEGESAELMVVYVDATGNSDITSEVTFEISEPGVVAITSGSPAIVTALEAGQTEVTASHDGISSNSITMTVRAPVVPDRDISDVYVFSSKTEVLGIRKKVAAGEQPWKSAFSQVFASANKALNKRPLSVVDNGAADKASGNPHRFGTDDPYTSDGVFDANADRTDYFSARDVGRWARDLSITYALTGEDQYAQKCIDFLYHWAVNPATYMEPEAKNYGPHTSGGSPGGAIEIYVTIPQLFYAAALVGGHWYWQTKAPSAESDFLTWTRDLLEDADGRHLPTNNIGAWLLLLRGSAAALMDDSSSLQSVYDEWRDLADVQIDGEGKMVRELHRTLSLHYSLYGLKALTLTAEIAKQRGVNLYDYDGALRRAFDFHAPYLKRPSSWPYDQIDSLNEKDAAAPYEFAHSFWKDADYLSVLNSVGRPMKSNFVMGYTTLMHGDLFRLEE